MVIVGRCALLEWLLTQLKGEFGEGELEVRDVETSQKEKYKIEKWEPVKCASPEKCKGRQRSKF